MEWKTWEGSTRALIGGIGSEFAYGEGRKSKSGQLFYRPSLRLRPQYRYCTTWTNVMDSSIVVITVMIDVLRSSLKEGTVAYWNGHTPTTAWWRRTWKAKASLTCLSVSRESYVGVPAVTLNRQGRSEVGRKRLPKRRNYLPVDVVCPKAWVFKLTAVYVCSPRIINCDELFVGITGWQVNLW
jgi:hypothetical protein